MKNKLLLILLAIAVFIPSVVAIISYNTTNSAPVSERNVRTMTISDLSGNTFTFTRGENDVMIDFFLEMNRASTEVTSLPEPLVGTDFFKVTMSSSQKNADYQYYFSTNTAEAYYQDADGKSYKIPASYAAEFVEGKYAVSLYVNAVVPTLSVSEQATVQPAAATWMYKNSAGAFVACDTVTAAAPQNVSLEGGLSLLFSIDPDYFNVKLTDTATGEVVFNDLYANISALEIDKSMQLNVEVLAKWYEDAARDYYGEMQYNFTSDISAPAEFFLGVTEIENGEFIVVSAKNVVDPSKIVFTSTPDIGYTPTFYKDGEYAIGLVPFKVDLAGGTYTLSFKYGGVTENLTVDVTERNVRLFQYQISSAVVNSSRTAETIAEFKTATADAAATGEPTQLWEGLFIETITQTSTYDGVIGTGFGHSRKIMATGETYTHEGVDYIASAGRDIVATNNGKVVFAGYTALGGNTIVIEHGYGLKSWYSHLSEIGVAVGDTVAKGDAIGKTGKTGFTKDNGVHFGLTVFDVPVCPYRSWDAERDGVKIVK